LSPGTLAIDWMEWNLVVLEVKVHKELWYLRRRINEQKIKPRSFKRADTSFLIMYKNLLKAQNTSSPQMNKSISPYMQFYKPVS
jgi:hypothetical protein